MSIFIAKQDDLQLSLIFVVILHSDFYQLLNETA